MSSEPTCQTLTFSGFGVADPNGQSYEGLIVTKTCEWINGQIIYRNAGRGYYVYWCALYQDWRLALSNNNLADCQAFAKTKPTSVEYFPSTSWLEWNNQNQNNGWQYSSGTVSCDTGNSITCGVAPETGSSDESGKDYFFESFLGVLGALILLVSGLILLGSHCRQKRLRQAVARAEQNNPAPALNNAYYQQTVATNPYNHQKGAGYNPAPSIAAPHDHQVANSPYNPGYGVATRNFAHQHREVEAQVEGQVEGGTTGYQPSAPPPPAYSVPPPGNNAPPAYYI